MHIINDLHFCFGQLLKIVKNFSCQKICTIQKKAVLLHRISAIKKRKPLVCTEIMAP